MVPAPAGASLKLPPGFSAEPALKGLEGPRVVRAAPNGDIFLTESEGGRVRALRFEPGKAAPVQNEVFAGGLDRPFGVAFYPPGPNPTHVYVATQNQLLRYPYKSGELKPAGPAEKLARLPAAGAGHWTRDVAVSSDGATIYVSIGSKSNVAEGQHPFSRAETEALEKAQGIGASVEPGRALVAAFDPDGGNRRVFATGLRNCVGPRHPAGLGRSLVRRQRARHARRQSAARLRDACDAGGVLRLAVVLHRREPGPPPQASAPISRTGSRRPTC